jgi:hypothetical protein
MPEPMAAVMIHFGNRARSACMNSMKVFWLAAISGSFSSSRTSGSQSMSTPS